MAYYYTHDGQRFGPVSGDELKALAAAAKICPQDAILCDADVQWKPAGELKELFQIDAKPTSSAPPLAQLVLPQVVPVSHLPLHVPLSPSTETILLPNRAVEYLRQSLQKVLPTLRLSVKRLFFEISKIATEAWFQTIRLVKYILWLIRGFSLARRARHSQLMLGEKLYRAGLGEDKVRAEIARIDNRIRNVQAANGSMRPLVTERRDFCIRLARSYPTKEIASAEVAQEYRDAKAAQNMVQSHQRERGCQRQALFPSTLLARLRVATGYGAIAILVFLLILLIAPSGSRPGPDPSTISGRASSSLDPVGPVITRPTESSNDVLVPGRNQGAVSATDEQPADLIINDTGSLHRDLYQIRFSSDYKTLAILCAVVTPSENDLFTFACMVKVWDIETGKLKFQPITSMQSSFAQSVLQAKTLLAFTSFDLSQDGKFVAIATNDGIVILVNARTGERVGPLSVYQPQRPDFSANPVTAAFSPDGRTLAAMVPAVNLVKLWDVNSRKEIAALHPHEPGSLSLCFSPDSTLIATGGAHNGRGEIAIWNAKTGQKARLPFPEQKSPVTWIRFFPDGRYLGSVTQGGDSKCWDIRTGQENWSGSQELLHTVLYGQHSADGRLVAAEHVTAPPVEPTRTEELIKNSLNALNPQKPRTHVTVWDMTSAKRIASFGTAHDWLFFSRDGKRLATGSELERGRNTATVWDINSGKALYTLIAEQGNFVAFPPDAKKVLTGTHEEFLDVLNKKSSLRLCDMATVPRLAEGSEQLSEKSATSEDDMPKLQGVWRLLSVVHEGKKTEWNLRPGPTEEGFYFVFNRDQLIVKKREAPMGNRTSIAEYSFKLDQSKNPRAIDTAKTKGPDTLWPKPEPIRSIVPGVEPLVSRAPPGPAGKGVYLLHEDELTMCFSDVDGSRPIGFENSDRSKKTVFRLYRPWDENLR